MEGLFGDVDSAVDDAIATDDEERAADPDQSTSPARSSRARRARGTALETASRAVAAQATSVAKKARRAKPFVPAIGGGVLAAGLVAAALWSSKRIEHGKPAKGERLLEANMSTIVPVVGVGVLAAGLIFLGLKAKDYVDGADAEAPASNGGNLFASTESSSTAAKETAAAAGDTSMDQIERELAGLLGS